MTELLVIPAKKPSEVEVVKPLKNLIHSAYNTSSSGVSVDYSEPVNEFSKLRNIAIWKPFEKYESSLEVIYGYYDQICFLETKIPAQELQIPFKWKDAFDKGSIFGGRISLTLTSLAYEKVCILFNIASLQSAVAATQSVDSDEGLKLATKLFQQAAGIFNHLKAITPAAIPQEPTPDLNAETLQVLSNLMIAQAQEIFVLKAIKDNMKDGIIAKLACQCEELYAEVLRGLQKDTLKSLWESHYISSIAGKQAGWHAMTQLYQSLVCRANKDVGEEIARLQQAVELFKSAQSRSGKPHLFNDYANRAQRHLAESKKDNDFIYNAIIPDVKTLNPPGKAQLAKPLPLSQHFSQEPKDLFKDLVPVALHQAMTACDVRKNEMVNMEILKLREATQTLNGILASLNLPAAIEVTSSGSLPPSLLDKARDVREKGGIDKIRTIMIELPQLLDRNREILDEADRMLKEECDADRQLRSQFKERWTRKESEKLTEMFISNTTKYREIINNAIKADKVVREKFDSTARGMELLSKSPEELEASVAGVSCSGGSDANISQCSSTQKLRVLMDSVETIKAERDVIESELKSATVNMKDQFLQALAKDGAINEPSMSIACIGQTIGPLQAQVQESITKQISLVNDIQETHKRFISETGSAGGSREALFTELATSYDNFIQLRGNVEEGTKFYNDLTQLLVAFQNKVIDYCFARKTEKDELLKDLTEAASRQGPAATPTVPSYAGSGGNTNPTRTAPPAPASTITATPASVPYPQQMTGMPIPYGASPAAPYPTYIPAPMPQSFNPYATLPYPSTPYNYQNFPQGPQQYGTYPGNYVQMQQQFPNNPAYPQQQQQQQPPAQQQPGGYQPPW